VTSGTVTRDGTTASEQFHTVDTIGQGGVVTRRERRDVTTTPDGAVTTQVGTGTFTDGKPTGTDQTFEYRFGPATATEHTVTEYVDGAKSTAVIDQHAVDTSDGQGFLWLYDQEKSGRISLTYGDDGQVVAVSQSGGGLNDVVSDHPTAAGETFVFTNVHTEPGDVDGVPTPALITGPGIIVHEGDVEIFQEGGIPGQAGDDAKQISDIRSYIQASPEGMRETLEHVNLLDGRNPQDVYWESEYGIEDFTSGAVGGGGQMTYFLGGSGESTFYHELGHISGTDGGAPDDDAWGDAIESDAGIDDTFMEQGVVVESGGTVGGGLNGVSDYADTSYTNSGSESEDWADSVELWLHSRRAGGLVTVKLPDGSTQTATFEELYPGRAAILEAFYGE
jgi:hypothetical protein